MDLSTVNQILQIFSWFPLAALLSILLLIARFYQNLTGEATRFSLFAVPIVLFGMAVVHYASIDQVMGSAPGDILMFFGGLVLMTLCFSLYRQMTMGR